MVYHRIVNTDSSLCCIVGPCCLPILYIKADICQPQPPTLCPPEPPPAWQTSVCAQCLSQDFEYWGDSEGLAMVRLEWGVGLRAMQRATAIPNPL